MAEEHLAAIVGHGERLRVLSVEEALWDGSVLDELGEVAAGGQPAPVLLHPRHHVLHLDPLARVEGGAVGREQQVVDGREDNRRPRVGLELELLGAGGADAAGEAVVALERHKRHVLAHA